MAIKTGRERLLFFIPLVGIFPRDLRRKAIGWNTFIIIIIIIIISFFSAQGISVTEGEEKTG